MATGLKRIAALVIGPIGYTLAMPWPMAHKFCQDMTTGVNKFSERAFLYLLFGLPILILSPIIAFFGGLAEAIFFPSLVYDRLSGRAKEKDKDKDAQPNLTQVHELVFGLLYSATMAFSVLAGLGVFNVLGYVLPIITLHFKYHILMLLMSALPASGVALAFATLGIGVGLTLCISFIVKAVSLVFETCVPSTTPKETGKSLKEIDSIIDTQIADAKKAKLKAQLPSTSSIHKAIEEGKQRADQPAPLSLRWLPTDQVDEMNTSLAKVTRTETKQDSIELEQRDDIELDQQPTMKVKLKAQLPSTSSIHKAIEEGKQRADQPAPLSLRWLPTDQVDEMNTSLAKVTRTETKQDSIELEQRDDIELDQQPTMVAFSFSSDQEPKTKQSRKDLRPFIPKPRAPLSSVEPYIYRELDSKTGEVTHSVFTGEVTHSVFAVGRLLKDSDFTPNTDFHLPRFAETPSKQSEAITVGSVQQKLLKVSREFPMKQGLLLGQRRATIKQVRDIATKLNTTERLLFTRPYQKEYPVKLGNALATLKSIDSELVEGLTDVITDLESLIAVDAEAKTSAASFS